VRFVLRGQRGGDDSLLISPPPTHLSGFYTSHPKSDVLSSGRHRSVQQHRGSYSSALPGRHIGESMAYSSGDFKEKISYRLTFQRGCVLW